DKYINESLWKWELFTEDYYVVLPNSYKNIYADTIDIEDIRKEPLITHQDACDTKRRIIEQFNSLGYNPNIVSEVAFGDVVFGAISTGIGITIVPGLIAKNIQHLNLFCLPISNFGTKRTISLVTTNKSTGAFIKNTLKDAQSTF